MARDAQRLPRLRRRYDLLSASSQRRIRWRVAALARRGRSWAAGWPVTRGTAAATPQEQPHRVRHVAGAWLIGGRAPHRGLRTANGFEKASPELAHTGLIPCRLLSVALSLRTTANRQRHGRGRTPSMIDGVT